MEKNRINFGIEPVNEVNNIFDDNIAFVKFFNFSTANASLENRIHAVTSIATICYESKSIDKKSMFDMLALESKGLPSSSFEFIPVLIWETEYSVKVKELGLNKEDLHMTKFSELVRSEEGLLYRLTNYRAVLYDFNKTEGKFDYREHYNQDAHELKIISENYNVFNMEVDLPTMGQLVRSRSCNFQVRSRRYVSDKKVPFEFYYSNPVKEKGFEQEFKELNKQAIDLYYKMIESGLKPQEARRVIPQSAYTRLWIGMTKSAMENFLKLRLDLHSQHEIRLIANAIKNVTTIKNLNLS